MSPFFPLVDIMNLGIKAGTVIGNNIVSGRPLTTSVADVLSKPSSPVVINQAPKTGLDGLGIGFVEKNVIIIGLLAVLGLYVYTKAKA